MKCTVTLVVEGIHEPVAFTGEVTLQDNGIGAYECHGYRGYDSRKEPTCEEYTHDTSLYTDEENKIIVEWCSDNDEEVLQKLEAQYVDNRFAENDDY